MKRYTATKQVASFDSNIRVLRMTPIFLFFATNCTFYLSHISNVIAYFQCSKTLKYFPLFWFACGANSKYTLNRDIKLPFILFTLPAAPTANTFPFKHDTFLIIDLLMVSFVNAGPVILRHRQFYRLRRKNNNRLNFKVKSVNNWEVFVPCSFLN